MLLFCLNCQVQQGKKFNNNVFLNKIVVGCNLCLIVAEHLLTIKSNLCFVLLSVPYCFLGQLYSISPPPPNQFRFMCDEVFLSFQSKGLFLFEGENNQIRAPGFSLYLFLKFLELVLRGLNLQVVIKYLITFIFPTKCFKKSNNAITLYF